ncbi:MAG: GDSL-type esterase/lipase family protein [Muribaculaceae bacterium]|nr:GDSL-type esterase/lipase family protein [Muribaculaceae bacterium]
MASSPETNTPDKHTPSGTPDNTPGKPGKPFLIIGTAVIILATLSLVPWGSLTGGFFKNFNLLDDISDVKVADSEDNTADAEAIDPLLVQAEKEANDAQKAVAAGALVPDSLLKPAQQPRVNGRMIIEDYSVNGKGLERFKAALEKRGTRTVRVGVIGDSYIEGDIYTSAMREILQQKYSGRGVGYVAPTNLVSGFRPTITQRDNGFTDYDLRKDSNPDCAWLSGQRFTADVGASVTWTAVNKEDYPHLNGWNTATILLRAPNGGVITTNTGAGPVDHKVSASKGVQAIQLKGDMTKLTLTNKSVSGLTLYGAWLNDATGITVDNMSLRGNSGITHRAIRKELARDMARYIDYDLIVVEYGLNACTPKQTDYTYYSNMMTQVIATLKEAYPNADIIMMGAGDRGLKHGSSVASMSTVPYMVSTQREVARKAGINFFDTREAMGGEGAILKWREEKLVNPDYIHMNFQGGKKMGKLFTDALLGTIGSTAAAPQGAKPAAEPAK